MEGIDVVYHLARSNVKRLSDYQRHEVQATIRIAEAAIASGVKRFIYTGTIDSYFAGAKAGVIARRRRLTRASSGVTSTLAPKRSVKRL